MKEQRSASPIWWVLFGVCVVGVFALGLWLMPQLRAATTYTPPTPTPIPPTLSPTQPPSPTPPPPAPTSSLSVAPDFTLPGNDGIVLTLSEQLDEGPVVLAFFRRVGG